MPDTGGLLTNGPANSAARIVLAHGAGAAMDSPFMNYFAEGLASHKIRVVRFEFPYMAKRRQTGKRGPPNRPPILIETWHEVIRQLGPQRLVIGDGLQACWRMTQRSPASFASVTRFTRPVSPIDCASITCMN